MHAEGTSDQRKGNSMEFLFDSANLESIAKYSQAFPITGVTSNPSILKAEGKIDFYAHMREIRRIIGRERTLHIQTIALRCDDILREAEAVLTHVDERVFIKIPTNEEGLKAMQRLKRDGIGITATAIYSKIQGFMAVEAGADYIAPYCNRMENANIDPNDTIRALSQMIQVDHSPSKIVAASFKNIAQVNDALKFGAHAVTLPPQLLHQVFGMAAIQQAIDDFTEDWRCTQGDVTLCDLAEKDRMDAKEA